MEAQLSYADKNLYQLKLISAIISYIQQGAVNGLSDEQKSRFPALTAWQCCFLTAVDCISSKLGTSVPLGYLARDLHMSVSAASHLVDNLVEHQLLERKTHEKDRRSVIITLSELGQQYANASRNGMLEVIQTLTSELTPEEDEVRLRIIEKLYHTIFPEKS